MGKTRAIKSALKGFGRILILHLPVTGPAASYLTSGRFGFLVCAVGIS